MMGRVKLGHHMKTAQVGKGTWGLGGGPAPGLMVVVYILEALD